MQADFEDADSWGAILDRRHGPVMLNQEDSLSPFFSFPVISVSLKEVCFFPLGMG